MEIVVWNARIGTTSVFANIRSRMPTVTFRTVLTVVFLTTQRAGWGSSL
ncbi:MAG: hypothetical protein HW384_70 [Dehalococcoidia bacterium]|nr:hypothetical protein [Dehalococcoidia bacterium]